MKAHVCALAAVFIVAGTGSASAQKINVEPVRQPRLLALISLIRAQPSTKLPPWISSRA